MRFASTAVVGSTALLIAWVAVACGGSVQGAHSDAGSDVDATDASQLADSSQSDADAGGCSISAQNYDTACSAASDCVGVVGKYPVQFGDFCASAMCWCGGQAINEQSAAQYQSDVSKTPWGTGAIVPPTCSCPVFPQGPCCIQHQCTMTCPGSADDGGDSLDSGGPLPDGSVLCALNEGPLEAGTVGVGPARLCTPPEMCLMTNGVWECCTGTGVTICVPPSGDF